MGYFEQLKKDLSKEVVLSPKEKTDAKIALDSLEKLLPKSIWSSNHPFGKIVSLRGPFLFRFLIYFNNVILKFTKVKGFKTKLKKFSNDKTKENFYSALLEFEIAYDFCKDKLKLLAFDQNISKLTPDLLMIETSSSTEFIIEIKNTLETDRIKKMKEDYIWLGSVLSDLWRHFHIIGTLYNCLEELEREKIRSSIDSTPLIVKNSINIYKSKNLELMAYNQVPINFKEEGIKAEFYKDGYIENTLLNNINEKLKKYSKIITDKRKLVIIISDIQIFYYARENLPIIKKVEEKVSKNNNLLAVILHSVDFGYSQCKYVRSGMVGNHEMIIKSKEDYSGERFWIVGSERQEDKKLIEIIFDVLKII